MAREQEIERARKRREIDARAVIDNPVFKQCIVDLRELLGIGPLFVPWATECEKIKDEYLSRLPEEQEFIAKARDMQQSGGWHPFEEDNSRTDDLYCAVAFKNWRRWLRKEGHYPIVEDARRRLEAQGISVSAVFLLAAVWFEYDGAQFETFLDVVHPTVKFLFWYSGMAVAGVSFEDELRNNILPNIKPNRIYLDVTDATLNDVATRWSEVQEYQRRMGRQLPTRGVPKDTEIQRTFVVFKNGELPGITKRKYSTGELADFLRQNPQHAGVALTAYERGYLKRALKHIKRKNNQPNQRELTPRQLTTAKYRAKQRFHDEVEVMVPGLSVTGITTRTKRKMRTIQ